MHRLFTFVILLLAISSCVPKKQVELRKINHVIIDTLGDGTPVLRGEAVFFNPNNVRMKLKEINIEVFVAGEKSAHADQKLNALIPANHEFFCPLEIQLSLKKVGL